jgi:hypothetical protein
VGVSLGREGFVGGACVVGGRGVAVKAAGVASCGEQERRKKKEERRTQAGRRCGMESILTDINRLQTFAKDYLSFNEGTSREVPNPIAPTANLIVNACAAPFGRAAQRA